MNTVVAPAPDAGWLQAAHVVIDRYSAATRGAWSRAAALLGRQALETAIDERFPELRDATGKARNLCLPVLLGDETLARDLVQSWGALSHATHHPYDLPPTAEELKRRMAPVAALVEANGSHVPH